MNSERRMIRVFRNMRGVRNVVRTEEKKNRLKYFNNRWSSGSSSRQERNKSFALYLVSVAVGVVGLSYAAVPLYKVFCQATGYGGTTQVAGEEAALLMRPVKGARPLKIRFSGNVSSALPWGFTPQQRQVEVVPGETALAFYTATNKSDDPVIGVSTYNVLPMKAGLYFNKIQCFCFDEQRLEPNEEVDMPVFFFIDPKFLEDPEMEDVHSITLSYTFFKSATATPPSS